MGGVAVQAAGSGSIRARVHALRIRFVRHVAPLLAACFAAACIARIGVVNGPRVFARARLEFPLEWSDEPMWMMARSFAATGHPYTALDDFTSYVYGPALAILLGGLDRLLTLGMPAMRVVSIGLAMLGSVGLFLATRALLRSRVPPGDWAQAWGAPCLVALLGFSLQSVNITFEALHPDNCVFAFVSLGVAAFVSLAARRESALACVGCGICFGVAAASKQTTPVIFVAGLVALRGLSAWRWSGVGMLVASFLLTSGAMFALGGRNGWEWAFQVPGRHKFELTGPRLEGLITHLTSHEWQLGLILVLGASLSVASLLSRDASPSRKMYSALWLATCFCSGTAYFKARGIWNNLYLPGVLALPLICAAVLRATSVSRQLAGALVFCCLPWFRIARMAPNEAVVGAIAETREEAARLCAENSVITVLWPIYIFRDCPQARAVLFESYVEVQHAALATPASLTKVVSENGGLVVTGSNMRLPELLKFGYSEDRLAATYYSWGNHFFSSIFTVYRPSSAQVATNH